MKKIILILFICFSFVYSNSLRLTEKDILILKEIKSLSDDKMTQYSLMAIAIKESSVGKYLVNDKSKDYGLFQANIKTVLSREDVDDTKENREYFSNKLVTDVRYAVNNALQELTYWQGVHEQSWAKTWASYNTGWKYESKTGLLYATSIFKIIKTLKLEYKL